MKFLVIGATGFIGPPLVRELHGLGHSVAVFHRGSTAASLTGVEEILGDHRDLSKYKEAFRRFGPDVVIDMILSSGPQAELLMRTFRGLAGRIVALSSMDVYRAFGIFHGTEPGPFQSVPITEESAIRQNLHPYPSAVLKKVQSIFNWMDDDYDKIPVERAVLGDAGLPGTVLRLPMVYGPGDPLHRFLPILKRIFDGRRRILFFEEMAAWHSPRGYVENVAAAIALVACDERATGKTYNVAEQRSFSELEWAQEIASQLAWPGEFLVLPRERMPKHLFVPGNFKQDGTASSDKIRRELDFREPVPFPEGMRRTIAWETANPPAQINPQQFDYEAEDAAVAA
jgi:nucleoside-diphosphate-sugar epimerase